MDRLDSGQETELANDLGKAFSMHDQSDPELALNGSDDESTAMESDQPVSSDFALLGSSVADLPKLSAVMPTSNGGAAVIDGKIIRVDQETSGGFRLVEVQRRSIIVERSGTRYVINIPLSE